MASSLAFDKATDGGSTTATSLTYSHTVTGTNPILFVSVAGSNVADRITTVTYNAVTMTLVKKQQATADRWNYLYVLVGPATGANNVVVNSSPSDFIGSGAVSYTGARQNNQPDASANGETTSSTSRAQAVTTVADGCWTVLFGYEVSQNLVAGAGSFRRVLMATTVGALFDSVQDVSPSGSKSMTVTGPSGTIDTIIASIAPFAVGGVEFDTSVANTAAAGSTTVSTTHVTSTSAIDRYGIAKLSLFFVSAPTSMTCTWGGVSMTLIDKSENATSGVYAFGLAGILTGSRTVTFTWVNVATADMVSESYRGVNTTTPVSATVKSSGTSVTPSVTVVSAAGQMVNDVVYYAFVAADTGTLATTTQQNQTQNAGQTTEGGLASNQAGVASTVSSWTLSNSRAWLSMGFAILPTNSPVPNNFAAAQLSGQINYIPPPPRVMPLSETRHQMSPGIPGMSVDNPPTFTRQNFYNLLALYIPPPPWAELYRKHPNADYPGESIDNPPIFLWGSLVNMIVAYWPPPPRVIGMMEYRRNWSDALINRVLYYYMAKMPRDQYTGTAPETNFTAKPPKDTFTGSL